jgi:hypothetical protein
MFSFIQRDTYMYVLQIASRASKPVKDAECIKYCILTKLLGLSPQANNTDRATAAYQRS